MVSQKPAGTCTSSAQQQSQFQKHFHLQPAVALQSEYTHTPTGACIRNWVLCRMSGRVHPATVTVSILTAYLGWQMCCCRQTRKKQSLQHQCETHWTCKLPSKSSAEASISDTVCSTTLHTHITHSHRCDIPHTCITRSHHTHRDSTTTRRCQVPSLCVTCFELEAPSPFNATQCTSASRRHCTALYGIRTCVVLCALLAVLGSQSEGILVVSP